jgi:hypothetical protein
MAGQEEADVQNDMKKTIAPLNQSPPDLKMFNELCLLVVQNNTKSQPSHLLRI